MGNNILVQIFNLQIKAFRHSIVIAEQRQNQLIHYTIYYAYLHPNIVNNCALRDIQYETLHLLKKC